MRKLILLLIGIFFLNSSFGQEIEMKLNLLGYKFVQNGERLNWNELVAATASYPESNLLIKKAKSQKTIAQIITIIGGGLTGIPIGQSFSDKDPNWTLAYIGLGITAVSIPFSLSAFNNANKGVDTYNLSLKSASHKFNPEFRVFAGPNGAGLSISF
ncbi:MAG: hypothetical protein WBM55_07460 [Muriicola sp.]